MERVLAGRYELELIAAQEFDLVLLDIMMPGPSGIEVLQQIRTSHSPDVLPVIMVTAKASTTDIVEALELGANDYITKPVDFSIAFARAQTQLARKQSKRALDRSLQVLESTNRRLEREIIERKRSDAHVHHLMYHDMLTSLGNREQFHAQLSRELQLLKRNGGCVAGMIFSATFERVIILDFESVLALQSQRELGRIRRDRGILTDTYEKPERLSGPMGRSSETMTSRFSGSCSSRRKK